MPRIKRIDVTEVFSALKNIWTVEKELELIFVILNEKMLKFVRKVM